QSGAYHPEAAAGLWVGAVAPRCLGGAGGDPVAAWLDGQRALQPPASARNPAAGKLFRPVSRACAGGLFALKTGSCCSRSVACASLCVWSKILTSCRIILRKLCTKPAS